MRTLLSASDGYFSSFLSTGFQTGKGHVNGRFSARPPDDARLQTWESKKEIVFREHLCT